MRDLTRGPIVGHIAAMAAPIAVGMLVQTLYFLVDLYFVSRLGGVALAGVSAAGNVMFLVLALTQMLSVGTIAVVSQAVGAEDRPRANRAFHQAVMLAAVLAAATLLGGYLGLADLYVGTIGADQATTAAGLLYLRWFVPAMALQFVITAMGAALQGTGVVKPTMVVQLLGLLTNIILTPILVAGWGTGHPLGVLGAGLASALAAAASASMMAFYFVRLERYVRFDPRQLRLHFGVLRRMLSIGMPSGAEFFLMFVYMAVIYSVIADFGSTAQAGFGVGVRMMQAVFMPAMAIALATPAIAGQNFGAKNPDRVRKTFTTCSAIIVVVMAALTLLFQWRPGAFLASFSSDADIPAAASGPISTIPWNFVATGLVFTCSSMFQGLGNTVPSLVSSATRIVSFVFPVFWLARQPDFYLEQVWYLSVATVTLQMVISLVLLRTEMAKRLRFETPEADGETGQPHSE